MILNVFFYTLITTILGFVVIWEYYCAFRNYKNGEDMESGPAEPFEDMGWLAPDIELGLFLLLIVLIIKLPLWICKKIFPRNMYVKIFRMMSFLVGFLFLALLIIFWKLVVFA